MKATFWPTCTAAAAATTKAAASHKVALALMRGSRAVEGGSACSVQWLVS